MGKKKKKAGKEEKAVKFAKQVKVKKEIKAGKTAAEERPDGNPSPKRAVLLEEPSEDTMADLAELFKVFGDSTRMRILFALFDEEIHVGGIAERLSMSQSAVSHQLRILRTAQLVDARREGKSIYYFLADDHVRTIIAQGMEHVLE